jgi:hypothetical protein
MYLEPPGGHSELMTKRFFYIFSKLNYRWYIFPGTMVQWTHLFLLFDSLSGRFVLSERPSWHLLHFVDCLAISSCCRISCSAGSFFTFSCDTDEFLPRHRPSRDPLNIEDFIKVIHLLNASFVNDFVAF